MLSNSENSSQPTVINYSDFIVLASGTLGTMVHVSIDLPILEIASIEDFLNLCTALIHCASLASLTISDRLFCLYGCRFDEHRRVLPARLCDMI